jgi:hypothetical protein
VSEQLGASRERCSTAPARGWRRSTPTGSGCSKLAHSARELPPCGLERAAARLVAALDPDGAAPDEHDRDLPRRRADALKKLFTTAHGPAGLVTDTRREDVPRRRRPAATTWTSRGSPRGVPEPSDPAATRALLTVTTDDHWLGRAIGHGTLDGEALTDVHTVRRWACDAEIIPMVPGTSSEPVDIGRRTRTVPDAIRHALDLRDGGCAFPGCSRRPRRCHARALARGDDRRPAMVHPSPVDRPRATTTSGRTISRRGRAWPVCLASNIPLMACSVS